MITLENVTFAHRNQLRPALSNLSIAIQAGRMVMFIGPNGAGKTTLFRLFAGLHKCKQGQMRVHADWADPCGHGLDRRKTACLLENPGVYDKLSAREYISFFRQFYPAPRAWREIELWAERLAFTQWDQRMKSFSLGEKQKVQILRCLCAHCSVLVLDEPTSHLDPFNREAFWSLMHEVNTQEGTGLLISSHQLAEIDEQAQELVLLDAGKVVWQGERSELEEPFQETVWELFDPLNPMLLQGLTKICPRLEMPENPCFINATGIHDRNEQAQILQFLIEHNHIPRRIYVRNSSFKNHILEKFQNHATSI